MSDFNQTWNFGQILGFDIGKMNISKSLSTIGKKDVSLRRMILEA